MNNLLPFQRLSSPKIHVYHPQSFEEARDAILAMKENEMLLVNLASLDSELAQRLTDYLAGSTYALSGVQTEIGNGVFLFAPRTFTISSNAAAS